MQMLKKLLNSENKYFLELDDIKESEVVQTAVKTAKKAANVAKEAASEAADTAQETLQSTTATEDTNSKKAKAKSKQPEPASDSQAKAKKNGKVAEKSEPATQEKPASTPENTGASSYEPPFWVAAMYNNNSNETNSNGGVAEPTFATDNLMPIITKSRRRPGGSLNKFKEMAKQAKTPKG